MCDLVSQFTLYGQVIKGSKPDFHMSMKSDTSKQMYHDFLERLKKAYTADKIKGKKSKGTSSPDRVVQGVSILTLTRL